MRYGTIDARGAFTFTGKTLHGAKVAATRTGAHLVATASPLGYNIELVARRLNGAWGTL